MSDRVLEQRLRGRVHRSVFVDGEIARKLADLAVGAQGIGERIAAKSVVGGTGEEGLQRRQEFIQTVHVGGIALGCQVVLTARRNYLLGRLKQIGDRFGIYRCVLRYDTQQR